MTNSIAVLIDEKKKAIYQILLPFQPFHRLVLNYHKTSNKELIVLYFGKDT